MKKFIESLICFILLTTVSGTAQTVRMNAVKANDYGVAYSLPKTSFVVTFGIKKTTYKRGDFYQFSQRYLGIDNPILEDRTVYEIQNVLVVNKGIPDRANSFMVSFRPNTVSPFVTLTQDGLICAINADGAPDERKTLVPPATNQSQTVNARRLLSEEVMMAGSTAKQAELVSKQIFDLRRSRNDILTGEAENMPPDGSAYQLVIEQINTQEKALMELFSGSEQVEYITKEITIVPDENNIDRRVVARFSEKLGLLDADNLGGAPIFLSLTNKTPNTDSQLSAKDRERFEKKLTEGIVYNIPGKATLTLEFKGRALSSIETDVVQFGSKDVLTRKMFDNAKQPIKVIFHTELGAIKQIIQ